LGLDLELANLETIEIPDELLEYPGHGSIVVANGIETAGACRRSWFGKNIQPDELTNSKKKTVIRIISMQMNVAEHIKLRSDQIDVVEKVFYPSQFIAPLPFHARMIG
jgi:hypothetical protein